MKYLDKLEFFIKLAEEGWKLEDPNPLLDALKSPEYSLSDIGNDLEIIFREMLDRLLKSHNMVLDKQIILKLLNYSIQIGVQCSSLSPNIPKIPFLLIEDLLEGQTIQHATSIWEIIESMVDTLTLPELFNRGKFVILRTCNSLLRRLSKSCHTEFCGRVLMFLAAIYPLSERSAVNLMGKVNTGNITGYEDQTIFESNDTDVGSDLKNVTTEWDEIDEGNDQQMEIVHQSNDSIPPRKQLKTDSAAKSKTRDYSLYKTFWNIQSYLSSDPKTLDSKNSWPSLMADVETILLTFESDGFRKSEILSAKEKREAAIKAASSPESNELIPKLHPDKYMGCKFLTSSQLFALELSDPAIRQQICTQLLILIHHRIKTPPPPPAPAVVVSTSKRGPPPPEPALFPSIEELKRLQNRIFGLLEITPPGGEDLANTLRTLFCESREDYWMKWKQDHCPSFERNQLPDDEVLPGSSSTNKRKAGVLSSSKKEESYYFEHSLESAQDFLDAEDPEAGIDDEYHPKHDSVYCWRARRLMANHRLSVFEQMGDGNIAKGLEILYPKAPTQKREDETKEELINGVEGNEMSSLSPAAVGTEVSCDLSASGSVAAEAEKQTSVEAVDIE